MEFEWTEERRDLRRGAADFAARRLTEGTGDRDRRAEFPRDLWEACAELGLPGLTVPREWDGGGQDLLSAGSSETSSRGCGGWDERAAA